MQNEFPIIKNIDELSTTKLRRDALEILEAGFESVMMGPLVNSKVSFEEGNICIADKKFCLADYDRIFLVAVGKCANTSATAFEDLLGDKLTGGIVLDIKHASFKKLISEAGTHPFPSEANVEATKKIVDLVKNATERDLVFVVISGGGSSLLCLPCGESYEDEKRITGKMMKSGADINEMNIIRKHISCIKGGRFAEMAYPATVVSFIISDVPGDDISVVASGPTVMDDTTVDDAKNILEKYGFDPNSIHLSETPKDEKYFKNVSNILLGSNIIALEAMQKRAEDLGYDAYIEDAKLEGEAKIVGEKLVSKEILPNSCHLWGGETTVVITHDGKGGRVQEFVLGAMPYIPDGTVVVGAASDGWDNTDVAGAIADYGFDSKALNKDMIPEVYLEENRSYEFFQKLGGHIKTGRTGTNVSDFYMILKSAQTLSEDDEIYDESEMEEEFEEDEKNEED